MEKLSPAGCARQGFMAAMVALSLAGCGGGGGGDSVDPSYVNRPYTLSVDGGGIAASFERGKGKKVQKTLRFDRSLPEGVDLDFNDPADVLGPELSLSTDDAKRYTLVVQPSATLPPGHHAGTIKVTGCLDTSYPCTRPVPGSPWEIPYDFTVSGTAAPPPVTPPVEPSPVEPQPPEYKVLAMSAPLALDKLDDELPPTLQVYGALSGTPAGPIVPRFVAPEAVFSDVQLSKSYNPFDGFQVSGVLRLRQDLQPGVYQGQIELRTCADESCSKQHSAPGVIPYSFTIRSSVNLTPLKALPGAADWSTDQGNASRTGYVPAVLDPTRFTLRWRRPVGNLFLKYTRVATASDAVFIAARGHGSPSYLMAINEADSQVRWTLDTSTFKPSAPATLGSTVYVAATGGPGQLRAIDAVTGTVTGFISFGAQSDDYGAPTPFGGAVYNGAGYFGGFGSFDLTESRQNWVNTALPMYTDVPAVDAEGMYLYRSGELLTIDRSTGEVADRWPGGVSSDANLVLTSNKRIVVAGGNGLAAFDRGSKKLLWKVSGSFYTRPAVAGGVVYLLTRNELQARSEVDGQLLWSWKPTVEQEPTDGAFEVADLNVVVTDNIAFVSTARSVYGVDLASRTSVWRYPAPGRLAISRNGVLYIAPLKDGTDPRLTAINLR